MKILDDALLDKINGGLSKEWQEELDEKIQNALLVLKMQRHGKLLTMTVRGETDKVVSWLNTLNPIYCEAVPLTLEEIFISETEVAGYDINNILK